MSILQVLLLTLIIEISWKNMQTPYNELTYCIWWSIIASVKKYQKRNITHIT